MAMGAGPRDVLRMVLGQGLLLGLIGVALGATGALALTRLIRGLLFGISSFDPVTFLVMAALLTAVSLAACWVPARGGSRGGPIVARPFKWALLHPFFHTHRPP